MQKRIYYSVSLAVLLFATIMIPAFLSFAAETGIEWSLRPILYRFFGWTAIPIYVLLGPVLCLGITIAATMLSIKMKANRWLVFTPAILNWVVWLISVFWCMRNY